MVSKFENQVAQTLEEIKAQGLFKTERVITGPQNAHIAIADGKRVINMCANNYLRPGRSSGADRCGQRSARHPWVRDGERALHLRYAGHSQGTGSSALTRFLGTEDTILYPSCFDANGGLFETLLGEKTRSSPMN